MGSKLASRSRLVAVLMATVAAWMTLNVVTSVYNMELDQQQGSQHGRFLPRYKTTYQIRENRRYIVHDTIEDTKQLDRQRLVDDINNRQRLVEHWRPHLVAKRGMLGIKPNDDNSMVRAVNPGHKFSRKCDSCAVVSNAGMLLGGGKGAKIDKSDCVFRFGFGPLSGHTKDIGTKETLRLVEINKLKDLESAGRRRMNETENVFVYSCESDEDCKSINSKNRMFYFTEDGMKTARLMFDNQNAIYGHDASSDGPSATWYMLLLLKHAQCKHTDMYGFPPPYFCRNEKNRSHRLEYWNVNSARLCQENKQNPNTRDLPSLEEKKLLHRWAWNYKMAFLQPSW